MRKHGVDDARPLRDRGARRDVGRRDGTLVGRACAAPTAPRRRSSRRAVIRAVGQLNRPNLPDIPGHGHVRRARRSTRRGGTTTSTSPGKRVAMIGAGASGFQIAPTIAADVEHAHRVPAHRAVDVPEPELPRAGRPGRARGRCGTCRSTGAGTASSSSGRRATAASSATRVDPDYPDQRARRSARSTTLDPADVHRLDREPGRRRPRAARQGRARLPGHRQAHAAGQRQLAAARSPATTSSWCRTGIDHIEPDGVVTVDGDAPRGRRASCYATGFHANQGSCARWRSSAATASTSREQWGERAGGVPRHHRARLPEPVLHVRPGHEPRARRQPDLPLRVPDALHHAVHRGADRRRAPDDGAAPGQVRRLARAHPARDRAAGVVAAVDQALVLQERRRRDPRLSPWRLVDYWTWTRTLDPDDYVLA